MILVSVSTQIDLPTFPIQRRGIGTHSHYAASNKSTTKLHCILIKFIWIRLQISIQLTSKGLFKYHLFAKNWNFIVKNIVAKYFLKGKILFTC